MTPSDGLQVSDVLSAFARKLTTLNDRRARMNLLALSLQDPRDIVDHIDGLADHLWFDELSVETVDALGAQCLALRLALARVEALDITSGDDAA